MSRNTQIKIRLSFRFWLLALYLAAVFLLGGSSRDDVQSLLLLRPLAVITCGVGFMLLPRGSLRAHRALVWFAAALFVLAIVQLLPLPPALWAALPGRGVVAEIDAAVGLTGVWRPISLDSHGTWNALYSLFVPLAALLLALPLTREERFGMLVAALTLGLASGLWGLLQVSGGTSSGLYLYRVTTPGVASGWFANRNHQAALLASLFPMLAIFAWSGVRTREGARVRWSLALAAGSLVVPLLLVTGSRTGLVLGMLGLATVPLLYRPLDPGDDILRRRRKVSPLKPALAGTAGIAILGLLAVLFARAGALSRLLAADQSEDLRFQVWGPIARLAMKYLPFGTGLGSFDAVFRLNEPAALLRPTYLNHAHNDWLEIVLTGGIGAIALAFAAMSWWSVMTLRAWRGDGAVRDVAFARLGSIVLLMLALASVTDYPLRVPSLMCVAVIAAVWLHGVKTSASEAQTKRNVVDVAGPVE